MNDKNVSIQHRYLRQERLIALFVSGLLLFNYPLLSLFSKPHFLFGIPVLYLYFFIIWSLFLGLLVWIVHAKPSKSPQVELRENRN